MSESSCQKCFKDENINFFSRCGHKFHAGCIRKLYKKLGTIKCPKCKTTLSRSKDIEVILLRAREENSFYYEELEVFLENIYNCIKGQNIDLIIYKELVGEAIKFGLNIADIDSLTKGLLKYICENDLVRKLNMILDFGLTLNETSNAGNIIWDYAMKNEAFRILEKLKEIGFDPKNMNESYVDNYRKTKWLIKNGYEINYSIQTVCKSKDINLVKLFLQYGHDINLKDCDGFSLLHRHTLEFGESNQKKLFFLEELIDLGADIESVDNGNSTPLYTALKNRNIYLVNALLLKGANFHAYKIKELGSIFFYLLDFCNGFGITELETLLLNYLPGFDINERDSDGRTCLHKVIENRFNSEYIKLFLKLGAEANAQDINGTAWILETIITNPNWNFS